MSEIAMVAVGKLKQPADNIRSELGDVDELASSMKSVGVLEPLLVAHDMVVVCGSRRLEAAKKAGLKEVPAIVRPFNEIERIEAMLVENLQRDDLAPVDEAKAYQRLVELGSSQSLIATRVGRSQQHVSSRLQMLGLPAKVQKQVDAGKISVPHANDLAKLAKVVNDDKVIEKVVKETVDKGYSSQIPHTVQSEIRKRDNAAKTAAKIAELEKAGEKVVKALGGGNAPKGHAIVMETSYSPNDVEMKVAEHAKLDCHALMVHPHSQAVIEVCTKPDTHQTRAQKAKENQAKEEEKERKQFEKEQKEWHERRDFLLALVGGRVVQQQVIEASYLALKERDRWNGAQAETIACHLLEIVPEELMAEDGETVVGPDEFDWFVLLDGKAKKEKARAALALAIGVLEVAVAESWWDQSVASYFELLKGWGFKPGPITTKKLGEIE